MALRIIRKSSSQSQVELLKGTGDGKPGFSLLVYVDSTAGFEALKTLLADPTVQQQAEVLIYKSHDFAEQIRGQLPPLQHTAKLINESKPASWSLRLRTGIQEAGSEICLFMPFVPAADSLPLLPLLVQTLQQDPSLGMAGPALLQGETLLAAGQDVAVALPEHVLAYEGHEQTYLPEQLFYLYAGLPQALWQQLARSALLVPGVPLTVTAIRREAYLSLSWADQEWNLPWLAQDLALGLRQKQYRLAMMPESLNLSQAEAEALTPGEMPAAFMEKWQPVLRQVVFELYRRHGWRQSGARFTAPKATASIQDYLAQKG